MASSSLRSAIRRFRLGRSVPMAAAAAVVAGIVGHPWAALGIWIGVGLFVMNLILLHEIARSLSTALSRGAGRTMAVGSSVGRLLLLGVALALVELGLGREALLGACGGLFLAQVHLNLPTRRPTEAV